MSKKFSMHNFKKIEIKVILKKKYFQFNVRSNLKLLILAQKFSIYKMPQF